MTSHCRIIGSALLSERVAEWSLIPVLLINPKSTGCAGKKELKKKEKRIKKDRRTTKGNLGIKSKADKNGTANG